MLAFGKSAVAGLVLSIGATITATPVAGAQTLTHPRHKAALPAAVADPLAPGVELQTGASETGGARSRYFTETIGPDVTGSFGQNGREGQPLPLPDSSILKFGF
jgi:hypothetical protein